MHFYLKGTDFSIFVKTIFKMRLLILILSFHFIGKIKAQDSTLVMTKGDSVVYWAKTQLGATYKWGTCSPGKSFDCSGLTSYAYNKVGLKGSRSSSGLAKLGKETNLENAKPGDLLLFRGTNPKDWSVGHVGIVVSNENGKLDFIHCSSSKRHFGVVITEYYNSGYPKRFIGVRNLCN